MQSVITSVNFYSLVHSRHLDQR